MRLAILEIMHANRLPSSCSQELLEWADADGTVEFGDVQRFLACRDFRLALIEDNLARAFVENWQKERYES